FDLPAHKPGRTLYGMGRILNWLQGEFAMTSSATKSAIVTCASGGIGSSIAKRLAKDGFSVVVNYAGKPAPAQAVVADLKAAGGQGIAVQADVANAEDVE